MILIAESGSTKTLWRLLDDNYIGSDFHSRGINPYVQTPEQINIILQEEVVPQIDCNQKVIIYYYGAGCSTNENKNIVYSCLKKYFLNAEIFVEHDLLAAARAGYNGEKCIVAILGTGSNACVFDGKDTVSVLPNLGYILGDEGSGAHMGKMLIKDFLYQKMPYELREKFRVEFNLDRDTILNQIYKLPSPNRWLATFSHFIHSHIQDEYFNNLAKSSFREFFNIHISSLQSEKQKLPVHAIGSIAFYYQAHLKEVAEEFGYKIGKIVKSPMDELAKYHQAR